MNKSAFLVSLLIGCLWFISGCGTSSSRPYQGYNDRNSFEGFQDRKNKERESCYTHTDKVDQHDCLGNVGGSSFENYIHNNRFDSNN